MNTITIRSVSTKKGVQIPAVVIVLFLVCIYSLSKAQNVGINTTGTPADKSAIVDINVAPNYNMGLLIPRMSTAQRDNLATSCSCTPAQSLLIFNTTDSCFETYLGHTWHSIWCTSSPCTIPVASTAGTNTPSSTQIVWNWNTSAGATAYYYNTVNNFSTATSNGASTSYTQTSLSCNTTYTLYVWADNSCGNSTALTLTQTTSACGGAPTCGSQVWATANVNVGAGNTVSQATTQNAGQQWCLDDVPANCTTFGGLFEWASAMNLPNADNTTLVNGAGLPSCNPCTGAAATAMQGVCPSGYHVPSDLEWSQYEYCVESSVAPTGSTTLATYQTATGLRGSTLVTAGVYQGAGAKMKETTAQGGTWADGTYSNNLSGFSGLASGYSVGGTSGVTGAPAGFWSATESDASDAWFRYLVMDYSQSFRNDYGKNYGFAVRCLQN